VVVLTEALSNAVRHAHASRIEVVVVASDRRVRLSVVDDGVGITDVPGAGQGVRNITQRAVALGGSCTFATREPRGTVVEWTVPI
jgi:signal transduction histidine kinase